MVVETVARVVVVEPIALIAVETTPSSAATAVYIAGMVLSWITLLLLLLLVASESLLVLLKLLATLLSWITVATLLQGLFVEAKGGFIMFRHIRDREI